jgi:hypothetical protein
VAEALLADPPFDIAATATVGDEGACAAVGGTGSLILAPKAVPDDLLSCLRASGATLLAFHRAGSGDGLISTRRAEPAALVALSRWAAGAKGILDGKVGIVGGGADKTWIEATVPAVRAAGLQVVEVAFPTDAGSVGSAVRAFSAAGVTGVVLAAPADIRRQWSAQHAIIDPAARFVVADAHDGVTDEGYAPSFDGALALTSLRVPWFSRDHGETVEQADCRQRWEATAGRLLPGNETRWVHAWCQHISAAAAAGELGADTGRSVPVALRDLRIPSPLTSDLGPTADGWGPTQSAVVVWRASCRCWQEQTPFA